MSEFLKGDLNKPIKEICGNTNKQWNEMMKQFKPCKWKQNQ